MYALRAIARRAPRSASQLRQYSSKPCALRPTLQSITKPTSSFIASSRYPSLTSNFSTSAWRSDSSGQELAAKLQDEVRLESENNANTTESDSGVSDFLGQNDFWTLKDGEGEHQVLLERAYDDEKITVSFSIAEFNSGSMLPEDEMDEAFPDEDDDLESAQSGGGNTKGAINQGRTSGGNIKVAPEDSIAPADREELRDEEDDDFQNQQAYPANVNVLITRDGKQGALRFALITDGSGFTIDSVTHLPNATDDVVKSLRDPSDSTWAGPPFSQLDEELQTMMEQYLTSRGINESLATFIPDYIDVKEQREYLAWLGRVKEFVE